MKNKKCNCGRNPGFHILQDNCKRPSTHTPTPWEIPQGWDGHLFKDGALLGKMSDCRTGSSKANAAFIVRAVNAHEELVAALKRALEYCGERDEKYAYVQQMKQAIAKAEARS